MNKYKIVFVILHYQNMEVTIDSIEHLKSLNEFANHCIVVVDNASPNGTGEVLKDMYRMDDNIFCLLSEHNGGFAYGNNIGYEYAKNVLKADIIVAMNSDVNIEDEKFIERLNTYARNNPDISIIAPDIIIKNGCHQNPYLKRAISTEEQKKIIFKKQVGWVLYGLPFLGELLLKRKIVMDYQPYNKSKVEDSVSNIIPHGACVIYMPRWTQIEKIAFINGTFLFVEEELLFDYCMYKKHSISYEPEFTVFHMEDASQNAINSTQLQKKRNQMKFEIQSRKLLIKHRKVGFKK